MLGPISECLKIMRDIDNRQFCSKWECTILKIHEDPIKCLKSKMASYDKVRCEFNLFLN